MGGLSRAPWCWAPAWLRSLGACHSRSLCLLTLSHLVCGTSYRQSLPGDCTWCLIRSSHRAPGGPVSAVLINHGLQDSFHIIDAKGWPPGTFSEGQPGALGAPLWPTVTRRARSILRASDLSPRATCIPNMMLSTEQGWQLFAGGLTLHSLPTIYFSAAACPGPRGHLGGWAGASDPTLTSKSSPSGWRDKLTAWDHSPMGEGRRGDCREPGEA